MGERRAARTRPCSGGLGTTPNDKGGRTLSAWPARITWCAGVVRYLRAARTISMDASVSFASCSWRMPRNAGARPHARDVPTTIAS